MGFVVPKPQAMPHFHPLMQAIYQETLTEQGGVSDKGILGTISQYPPSPASPLPVLCIPGNVNRKESVRSPPRTRAAEEPVWGRRQQPCRQSAPGGFGCVLLKCLECQCQRWVPGERVPRATRAPRASLSCAHGDGEQQGRGGCGSAGILLGRFATKRVQVGSPRVGKGFAHPQVISPPVSSRCWQLGQTPGGGGGLQPAQQRAFLWL